MYKVGIVGAGVGGSYLSYLLSKRGVDNIVFDFRTPHEKLCGGGVSYKTVAKFPIIDELPCPRKVVWKSTIISPKDRSVSIEMEKPLTLFHRRDLDYSLLKKAREFGAHLRKEKVCAFTLKRAHWSIFTETGNYTAEILVGADGALSRTRRKLSVPSKKGDYFFALQCFLDVEKDMVIYKFFSDLKGYLWSFPRVDNLAVGIAYKDCRNKNVKDMKDRLFYFIERYYPEQTKRISLRGAYIPFFSAKNLQDLSICSKNWALIGDAASFVEPISGEGIYYAIYSAEILAKCILKNELTLFQQLCMKHFGKNLVKAGQIFDYFYQADFLETMVTIAQKSKAIRKILSEMVAGNIDYLSLKGRFRKDFFKILYDCISDSDLATKKEWISHLIKLFPDYLKL